MDNTKRNKTIKEAYNLISEANKVAYLDIFLLSNQVLSKNPFTNNFINRFINGEDAGQVSTFDVASKLLFYYINSFKKFSLYLIEFLVYYLHPISFRVSSNQDKLILIDTFFLLNKIKSSNNFSDSYFPGLKDVLDKTSKVYAYLPIFVGSKKFLSLRRVLKILKKQNIPTICEYQLLSMRDILYLFYFIVFYPFHVLGFANGLSTKNHESTLLKSELLYTLDSVTFESFSRYLQGRKIARLPYRNIKVISWYENQVKDKNLYKGLKEYSSKVKIYGAQLFLYSNAILNIITDENEEVFGIIPDKIIVNGPAFIPEKTRINYHVGPSLRYSKIFSVANSKKRSKENILTLLPYIKNDTENILQMISRLKKCSCPIRVKLHPAVSFKEVERLVPSNVVIVKDDICNLFESAKIIIGSASGTLVEAASLGIPVIVVKNNHMPNYNILPEYGKGLIWEEASTVEELSQNITRFESLVDKNSAEVASIANKYKEMFFCNPTEENILKAFDL